MPIKRLDEIPSLSVKISPTDQSELMTVIQSAIRVAVERRHAQPVGAQGPDAEVDANADVGGPVPAVAQPAREQQPDAVVDRIREVGEPAQEIGRVATSRTIQVLAAAPKSTPRRLSAPGGGYTYVVVLIPSAALALLA